MARPVTNEAASDSGHATASPISAGAPKRPDGWAARNARCARSSAAQLSAYGLSWTTDHVWDGHPERQMTEIFTPSFYILVFIGSHIH